MLFDVRRRRSSSPLNFPVELKATPRKGQRLKIKGSTEGECICRDESKGGGRGGGGGGGGQRLSSRTGI